MDLEEALQARIVELEKEVSAKEGAENVPAPAGAGASKLRMELIETTSNLRKTKALLAKTKRKAEKSAEEVSSLRERVAKVEETNRRLSDLCRTLQAAKKEADARAIAASDESLKRSQDILTSVSSRLDEQQAHSDTVVADNAKLHAHIKALLENSDAQTAAHEVALKTKDLERQLAEAKFRQQEEIAAALQLRLEKQQLELVASKETERDLLVKLQEYAAQMQAVQSTLMDSGKTFDALKMQRLEAEKTIKGLVKERKTLASKVADTEVRLVKSVQSNTEAAAALTTALKQKDQLQSLCQTLQAERRQLRADLAAARDGTAAPPAPEAAEPPAPGADATTDA